MSTERLLDDEDVVVEAARPLGSAGATPTLDLDAAAAPPRVSHPGLPWGTVVTVLMLCAGLVGTAEPRLLPTWRDLAVTVAPAIEPWDGVARPLGAARVVVRVRNTSASELEVSRAQILNVGSPPMAARAEPARLEPDASARMLVDVLPDCRFLPADRDAGLVVQLTVRGPGGGRSLRLIAAGPTPPLRDVCPEPMPGLAITATAHRGRDDAGWVVVRFVNTGTEHALLARSLNAPVGLQTQPKLPRHLEPGEAMIVRLKLAPGTCLASPVSLLQAQGRWGHAHVAGLAAATASLERAATGGCSGGGTERANDGEGATR